MAATLLVTQVAGTTHPEAPIPRPGARKTPRRRGTPRLVGMQVVAAIHLAQATEMIHHPIARHPVLVPGEDTRRRKGLIRSDEGGNIVMIVLKSA